MKGFIIALTIFSLLVTSLIFYNLYISETFSSLSSYIDIIEDAIEEENYSKAKAVSYSFEKKLSNYSEYLYYVTDRAPLDSALTECSKMISFIKLSDQSEAYASARGINVILEKTKEKSILKLPFKD